MAIRYTHLRAMIPLFLAVFMDSLGNGIIFPILTPLIYSPNGILPIDATALYRAMLYGVMLGLFALGMFFSTPILGEMSDRIGRKKILLFCLGGISISYVLAVMAVITSTVSFLVVSRLIAGLCAGSVATAQAAIIDVSPPEQKTKYLSLLLFPSSLGFAAGPMCGSFLANSHLVSWFTYWTPLAFAAVLAIGNVILLGFAFKETFLRNGSIKLNLSSAIYLFSDAFSDNKIRHLSIVYLLFQLSWGSYFQYISLFMFRRFDYDAIHLGYFMTFIATSFAFTYLYLIPLLTQYFQRMPLLRYSLGFNMLSISIVMLAPHPLWVWVGTFLNALSNGLAYSVILSLFSDTVGSDKQGWIMGVTAAVNALSFAITAIIIGILNIFSLYLPLYIATIAVAWAVWLSQRLR